MNAEIGTRATGVSMRDVVHRYPTTQQGVLGVSLNIEDGELLAVIGPSGCGKSTLLRLVAGLLPVHQGMLTIAGQEVAKLAPWQRNVGMVFQNYALFPHLDVVDNVAYGLRMRGVEQLERRRRAMDMLATVGLADMAYRRPSALSGGQQQRVALARALAFGPSVLLLDEPLAALDAHIRAQLGEEIRDIQRRSGAATLFVTHDQQEALMMADRVAVMDRGRLLQVDTPQQLYKQPASVAVARFVGQSNLLAGTVVTPDSVRCTLGLLRVPTHRRQVGSRVHLLIRPEALVPDPGPDMPNRLSGIARRVRFMGSTCRWDFQPAPDGPVIFGEGAVPEVSIGLDPTSIVMLDHDPNHPEPAIAPPR
ncbi:MAG: hypothetical protein RLZ83_1241 [Pseudomonadota bacterium]|jgi:putative spermidine/putrescine transport system ATP-binding protein